ncbi:uncharacterized protein LOC113856003 [Abrus precatorius]|uniref:Mannose/glucose-specific lectin n=1 Tax=Abrus precatorius TaxID=3816 RepID=A0A8B8KHZ2_ABRPR|nr:uncharacterized protein LOC113856003 [Abrus precatorius]
MVSDGVPLHLTSGRKRKHKVEDNSNCVREDLDQMDQSVESVDRISQLPDHVIHHILSHLRNVKDAIRTSTLSKRWRALWYSFSILIFDERRFAAGNEHEDASKKEVTFRDYVSNYLHGHLAKKLYIQKLMVHMTSFDLEDTPFVNHWLSVAIARNVQELDLHVGIKNNRRYTLPKIIFSCKTLTGIRLSGCKLETCDNIMLPRLQKLYLRKLSLVDHMIQNMISGCHSIEDLRVIKCSGLKHLNVSNLIQLSRVEVHNCNQLKKVEISDPNLHTFWFCGKNTTSCKVSLEGCTSLKRLTLEHTQVIRDFCENQISNFPLLEKLDLSISGKMKHVMISNTHLQKFALKGCKKLGLALLETPNLVSFECKGESMPWTEIHPFRLNVAKLSFISKSERKIVGNGDKIWFLMKAFIKKFDSEEFRLVLYSNKNIVVHENLNNFTLPPAPDLSCEIIKSSARIDDTLYSLLRTLHPVTLSIISPFDSKFPKLVCETIKNEDEDPICCKFNALNNKCWRHFMKDVKFEDLNDMTFEDIEAYEDKRTSNWYNWLKSSYAKSQCQITNLRLYWNSHQQDRKTEQLFTENIIVVSSVTGISSLSELIGLMDGTNKKTSVTVGPWGGEGGTIWDDGTFTGVREIKLVYDHCIDSIHVVYDRSGKPFRAEKHGGVGGTKTAEIKLQYPDEMLISVSGHYSPVTRGGTPVIRSLTLKSNRRSFGPYGVEEGTPFTFSIEGGCVVGFKGRSDWYLDAIAFTVCSARPKSLLQKMQRGFQRLASTPAKSSFSYDA